MTTSRTIRKPPRPPDYSQMGYSERFFRWSFQYFPKKIRTKLYLDNWINWEAQITYMFWVVVLIALLTGPFFFLNWVYGAR